jgi:hypothetical protein
MRRVTLTLVLIGAGAMVAAWIAFWAAMTDGNPVGALLGGVPPWSIPAVVIVAGAVAAAIDRRPRGLATVVAGACGTVLAFTAWLGIQGQASEPMTFAAIGIGLAIVMLTIGFVPVALIASLVHRPRQPAH